MLEPAPAFKIEVAPFFVSVVILVVVGGFIGFMISLVA